jgi:copper chaperone NosL
MKKLANPRLLVLLAALLLLPAFVAPLWSIGLVAPQYPDGLGMDILVHDIRGHDRHDLQNINILNHYIGMQPILPEEVPELEYMPKILAALVIAGILAALIGHRWVLAGWLAALLGLGAAGMVDFYMWKVDYGTNLSPDAPITVPGMTYQPPLIGTKQLLNITASSWPSWGTLFITLSALSGAAGVWLAFRKHKEKKAARSPAASADGNGASPSRTPSSRATSQAVVLSAGVLLLGACGGDPGLEGPQGTSEPRTEENAIVYGQDQDPFCEKEVDQVRWGGEIRTRDGERLRFRSVECLAGFLLEGRLPEEDVDRVRVVDFADGWRLVDAAEAFYLHSPLLNSPDGARLHALARRETAEKLKDAYTGPILGWDEVLELVVREWARAREG